jgi:hypothetical protein
MSELHAAGGSRHVVRTRPVRPGPASYVLLGWLGRLGLAGVEPLAVAHGISVQTTYSHIARLAKLGLVMRPLTGDGAGGAVALTRAGARVAREMGADGVVAPRSAAPSSARHGRAASWVAASAETRDWTWLGPAQLRAAGGWRVKREDGVGHSPDLGLLIEGRPTAVEVELHTKAPARVRAILRGYRDMIERGELAAVSYVTDRREVSRLLRREVDAAGLARRVQIGSLEAIVVRARERAASARIARDCE